MYWYVVTAACTVLAWSIWVRRWTLRTASDRVKLTERTITVALILQLAGLILMLPFTCNTVGRALHAWTGQWQLDTWAGHCCYIGAIGLIGLNVGSRLDITDDELRHYFRVYFGLPFTIAVPVMLALLCKSQHAKAFYEDFFDIPLGPYLCAYWIVLCGFITLILMQVARVLFILRRDPRNRTTANHYLIATFLGIFICLWRVFTVFDGNDYGVLFWVADATASATYGYASSRSWRQKIRWLQAAS